MVSSHWHLLLKQRSAGLQASQVPPPAPQESCSSPTLHSAPEQQPAQSSGSQAQVPLWQLWPMRHGRQTAPPVPPQASLRYSDGVTHSVPLQQPVGQEVPSQTQASVVRSQRCPGTEHAPHVEPGLPQASSALPALQAPPRQQPLGHEVASQTHSPFTQRWSDWHCTQAPPALPQASSTLPALQSVPEQQPEGQLVGSQAPIASPTSTSTW